MSNPISTLAAVAWAGMAIAVLLQKKKPELPRWLIVMMAVTLAVLYANQALDYPTLAELTGGDDVH